MVSILVALVSRYLDRDSIYGSLSSCAIGFAGVIDDRFSILENSTRKRSHSL
ncbi:MAG TPA: hypothetical protein V6C85_32190 [Allocoleopsis sp.]